MIEHLNAVELSDLIGCKPNQRCHMISWLTKNHWRFAVDAHGFPKVARAYYDRRLGVSEEKQRDKFADGPNREAFA